MRPRSRAARIAWAILATLLGLFAVALLSRDAVLKTVMLKLARQSLHTDVSVEKLHTGLFPLSMRMTGVTIGNPPGYPAGNALRVEEFYIRLSPRAFTGPTNQITEIRLNVSNVSVISKRHGRNNFKDLFNPVAAPVAQPAASVAEGAVESVASNESSESEQPSVASVSEEGASPGVDQEVEEALKEYTGDKPLEIGTLTLRIGVVDVTEERNEGQEPKAQHIDINGEHTLRNVTDLEAAQRELGSAMLMYAMPSLLHEAMKKQ